MSKSTFGEEQENPDLMREAFPTFRTIPARFLEIMHAAPANFLRIPRWLGKGWKKSWHYLLTAAIIISIPYVALDIYATSQLNHQLNLIRQKGEPLTLAEAAPPKVPNDQNAAILYERAAKALKLKLKIKYAPEDLSQRETQFILAQNIATIKLIREATAKPQCRFDLNWQDVPGTALVSTETEPMRNLFRLLQLQTRYEAQTGNKAQALKDIQSMFLMVRHLSGEPLVWSSFTALEMDKDANDTLAKVLLHVSLSPTQARQFEASLPVIDWKDVVHRFLLTERASNIEMFQLNIPISQWKENNPFLDFPDRYIWYSECAIKPLRKLDEARALSFWPELLLNAKSVPISRVIDYGSRINERVQHTPWYNLLTKMSIEVYPQVRNNFDKSEVRRREREIALALNAYRSQYRKYPVTLQEAETFWKSTFPLDPYSSKSFRYKSKGSTFLLYSVGMDGNDDGGKWRESSGSFIQQDIVWGH